MSAPEAAKCFHAGVQQGGGCDQKGTAKGWRVRLYYVVLYSAINAVPPSCSTTYTQTAVARHRSP